jgi:hypothetical protein
MAAQRMHTPSAARHLGENRSRVKQQIRKWGDGSSVPLFHAKPTEERTFRPTAPL